MREIDTTSIAAELDGIADTLTLISMFFEDDEATARPSDRTIEQALFAAAEHTRRLANDVTDKLDAAIQDYIIRMDAIREGAHK